MRERKAVKGWKKNWVYRRQFVALTKLISQNAQNHRDDFLLERREECTQISRSMRCGIGNGAFLLLV